MTSFPRALALDPAVRPAQLAGDAVEPTRAIVPAERLLPAGAWTGRRERRRPAPPRVFPHVSPLVSPFVPHPPRPDAPADAFPPHPHIDERAAP